jgi:hypothetical protein
MDCRAHGRTEPVVLGKPNKTFAGDYRALVEFGNRSIRPGRDFDGLGSSPIRLMLDFVEVLFGLPGWIVRCRRVWLSFPRWQILMRLG